MTREEMLVLKSIIKEVIQEDVIPRLDAMETRVDGLGTRLRKLEITFEHKIGGNVKVTMDTYNDLNRKINVLLEIENYIGLLERKISAIEYYIKNQRR